MKNPPITTHHYMPFNVEVADGDVAGFDRMLQLESSTRMVAAAAAAVVVVAAAADVGADVGTVVAAGPCCSTLPSDYRPCWGLVRTFVSPTAEGVGFAEQP